MDYIEDALNVLYIREAEFDAITVAMEKLGLDPDLEKDVETYFDVFHESDDDGDHDAYDRENGN